MESFSPRPSRPAQSQDRNELPARPSREPRVVRERESVIKPKSKKSLKSLYLGLAVVAVLVLAYFGWNMLTASGSAINKDRYQAVFLTNGQVYFGKLSAAKGDYYQLKDIYYLQASSAANSDNPQETSSDDSSNIQLIKLGQEVHGPEDEMFIAKDQLLFFENLKEDSKVVTTIKESK